MAIVPGTRSQSVDQYIEALPEPAAERLRAIRAAIREAVPEASETIAYQMPAYRYHGTLLYFGAFANHYSLFGPNVGALLEAFPVELEPYTRSKGTIRFPLNDPPPAEPDETVPTAEDNPQPSV